MADEPNKNMDETLRAYAEQRRKGADFPLHPATRRLLQGEVSRTFRGQSASPSWAQRFRAFWPQIAFGGGLCLVLGIAVLSLRQPGRNVAKENQAPPQSASNTPTDAPSVADLTPVLKQYRESELSKDAILQEDMSSDADKAAPSLVTAENSAEPLVRESRQVAPPRRGVREAELVQLVSRPAQPEAKAKEAKLPVESRENERVKSLSAQGLDPVPQLPTFADAEASAANTALPPSIAPTRTAASAPLTKASPANRSALQPRPMLRSEAVPLNDLPDLGAARKVRFVQVTNSPANTRGVVPMFSSFEVEQTGTDLRFLDQDGSVYFGALLTPSNDVKSEIDAVGLRRLQDQQIVPTNAALYYFTVRGTNVQSGKDVVLSGQYFEKTNGGQSAVGTLGVPPAQQAGRSGLPQLNARYSIIGNAVVGKSNQVPVNAVSRDP